MKKIFLAFSLLAVLGLGVGPAAADITTGLISYFPFSGNANDVIGGNNGTVYNATLTADRFGNPNSAYYFNGSNAHIELANNFNFIGMGTDLTFSAWVNSQGGGYIFVQGNGGDVYFSTGAQADFTVKLSDSSFYSATDPNAFLQNTWVNVVGVYHRHSELDLFVSGNLVATTGLPALDQFSPWWNWFYANIGAYHEAGHGLISPFLGSIDDFRIYDRALSDSDIQELAGVPLPGAAWLLSSGLLGLGAWRKRRRS